MQNLPINTNYHPKLYGSAVTKERTKASSLYQKRSYDYASQLSNNDNLQTSEYFQSYRKYSDNEITSKLAVSDVGKGERYHNIPFKEGNSVGKIGYFGNNFKSPRANAPISDRTSYNEQVKNQLSPSRKKNDSRNFTDLNKNQEIDINQSRDEYARIVQKLNRKEIIQEIKKICDSKISDNIRRPKGDQKGDFQVYYPSRISKKYNNISDNIALNIIPASDTKSQNEKVSAPSTFSIDLSKPQIFDKRHKLSTSEFLDAKQQKKPEQKVSRSNIFKINPQDLSKDNYKRNNSAYASPKEPKIYQFQHKNQEFNQKSKPSFLLDKPSDNSLINYTTTSKRTISDIPYTEQLYSPIKTRKSKELEEQKYNKYIKDVRHAIETKNIKNNSFFSNKKVSLHDFDLKKSLGQGKFGIVYQAFHKQTNSLYAIKKISKKVIKSNLMVDQLLQEIKIQSFCSHENILKLYGFFDDPEHIYIILEYMEEGTLFSHLKVNKILKEVDVKQKLRDIASAIIYLHEQGIAHRDIKLENIVMSNGVGKLCDFGWAAICTDRRKTYCGTLDYIAPEILEGAQYDASVDLWCLGVLAYELLVGKAPFYHIRSEQTKKKIMKVQILEYPSSLSSEAISFIDNLLKKNPEQRLNGQNILRHPFLQNIKNTSEY